MTLKRSRILTTSLVIGVILVPFVFLSSPLKPWQTNHPAANIWQDFTYPVEHLWHDSIALVSHAWTRYVALVNTQRDNETLRLENSSLKLGQASFQELSLELAELRRQLGLSTRFKDRVQLAEVIGRAGSRPFRSLRISRGANDGVKPGFPVVTADGAVGRILRAGLHHADVQIITDGDFSLDVLLQRSRVRGVLHGFSGDRCRLQLHRQAEVGIGDTVITSGIVGSFPKGLPVGRVVGISYETDNVTQVVTVDPWVDFSRLATVVVIERGDADIERIGATGGAAWVNDAIGKESSPLPSEGE